MLVYPKTGIMDFPMFSRTNLERYELTVNVMGILLRDYWIWQCFHHNVQQCEWNIHKKLLSAKCWLAKPIMRVCLDTSKQRLFTVRSAKRCCHWILAWCVLPIRSESRMNGTGNYSHWNTGKPLEASCTVYPIKFSVPCLKLAEYIKPKIQWWHLFSYLTINPLFNVLYSLQRGLEIVYTSPQPPYEISYLSERGILDPVQKLLYLTFLSITNVIN